jgi:hypothetical protein
MLARLRGITCAIFDRLTTGLAATRRSPSRASLRFGSDLSVEAVEALLTAVSGLPSRSSVALETVATAEGLEHALVCEQATLDTLRAQLRGLIPNLRLEPATPSVRPVWTLGARLGWTGEHALLRTDAASEPAATLLASLSAIAPGETVLLQVALRPARPRHVRNPANGSAAPTLFKLATGSAVSKDHAAELRRKYAGPLLQTRLLVATSCGHRKRAHHLLARLLAVYRTRRAGLGMLQARLLNGRAVTRLLERPPRGGVVLTPRELAGLIGWPIGAPKLPGLSLGHAPLLFPERRIPEQGRVIGHSTWPGLENRLLAQPVIGALSHTLITGPTGSGKSALLANLALADLGERRGLLILDGKGDLADDLLARIPQERVDDVIVLDPAAGGAVPGLRVFSRGGDPELAADLVLGVLRDLFRDSWGVRSDQWLRAGLVTLGHDAEATLGDLPYVFHEAAYRRKLVARVDDPLLRATWAAFEAMHPREQTNQLGAPLTKLSELLGRRVLRSVLSQQHPTLDLTKVLRQGKVVVVSLAPGRIGAPAARLLGALVVYQLLTAIQARSAISPAPRTPFFAYIDEPKVLGDLPVPLDSIFELARGLGVGLTLAVQSVAQLPTAIKNAALTNAATLVAFRQNHDEDAALLARHLPGLMPEALLHLGPFELIARIGLGPGDIAPPASGRSLPPPAPTSRPQDVRERSAQLYGRDPKQVDEELERRHGAGQQPGVGETPVGRRRRTSS